MLIGWRRSVQSNAPIVLRRVRRWDARRRRQRHRYASTCHTRRRNGINQPVPITTRATSLPATTSSSSSPWRRLYYLFITIIIIYWFIHRISIRFSIRFNPFRGPLTHWNYFTCALCERPGVPVCVLVYQCVSVCQSVWAHPPPPKCRTGGGGNIIFASCTDTNNENKSNKNKRERFPIFIFFLLWFLLLLRFFLSRHLFLFYFCFKGSNKKSRKEQKKKRINPTIQWNQDQEKNFPYRINTRIPLDKRGLCLQRRSASTDIVRGRGWNLPSWRTHCGATVSSGSVDFNIIIIINYLLIFVCIYTCLEGHLWILSGFSLTFLTSHPRRQRFNRYELMIDQVNCIGWAPLNG